MLATRVGELVTVWLLMHRSDAASLRASFVTAISTEQVARGKPAPDSPRRTVSWPERCAAVEDSTNGLRSAAAAGSG
jgi:beta-phosphoglucomutase-like phosphatase (HAD superfamily)